jgi:hypothetical protein
MPVRSLTSAVFKWPDREQVLSAARRWATALRRDDPAVELVGCIGSYARNDWGVGSDLDVIVVLRDTDLSRLQRHARYDPRGLPVPADLWVYTMAEWDALATQAPQLWDRLQREMFDLAHVRQFGS